MNGHYPKPGGLAAALAVLIAVVLAACSPKGAAGGDAACGLSDDDFRTEGILQAIPVRATFLDEVSWDIPHQNWGVREWDADFRAMKNMGINTVVLIRAGLGRWIAAPFECLLESEEVYYPPVDLVEMFLTLADKYDMAFYFGMYDSGKYWQEGLFQREIDLNLKLIDEVWARYGHHESFQGWYLSQEISRRTKNMSRIYAEVGLLGAVLFIGVSHLLNAFYVNDIYMQISLVMLIGLAAKNAILVVEYADRLFNEQGASLMDAAIGAAKLRVRPIIMTAFAFILGVMPLIFASGVYATARNIMGVALVGGMLFATLLGIFVYPALYYFVGRIGGFERRRERKKQEQS